LRNIRLIGEEHNAFKSVEVSLDANITIDLCIGEIVKEEII